MSVRITDKVTTYGKRMAREIEKMQGKPYAKVGFPTAAFDKNHTDKDGGSEQMTVGMIAVFNEFGTLTTPQRSFLRSTFDEKQPEIRTFIRARLFDVIDEKYTTEQALTQIALFGVKLVVEKLDSFIPPPNAPSTIAQKGSSHPLFDTGQMRATLLANGWEIHIPRQ